MPLGVPRLPKLIIVPRGPAGVRGLCAEGGLAFAIIAS